MKTVWRKPHGFESHPLRHTCGGQFAYRSFFIYISLDNFVFTAKIHMRWAIRLPQFFYLHLTRQFRFHSKNSYAVGNSPTAVFLFTSHSTISFSQQKFICGGQFAYRSFFIYISLDNFVFTAKIHMRWAIRLPQFFIYISLYNFVFTAKIHLRFAIFILRFIHR